MPERPDLEYITEFLRRDLIGATIKDVLLKRPVVLRQAVAGELAPLVVGQSFTDVERCGHFLRLKLGDALQFVISPMLAGRFDLVDSAARLRADVAFVWRLEDGRSLLYRDDKQMGKVYVIASGDDAQVPGLSAIGVDVLDGRRFTKARFRTLSAKRRDQVRVFLMDKSALDSLGNAYADEVLFEAAIHPKTFVRNLSDEELDRLRDAIVSVLKNARDTIRRRKPALPMKLRDFLKVRGRGQQPCPRCETAIRKAGVRGYDAYFCPRCQPDQRGSSIVDWRKIPKKR